MPKEKSKSKELKIERIETEDDQKLKIFVKSIEKEHGEGAILFLDDYEKASSENVIPTGSLRLNKALGIGGVARGRIIEIFGDESSGKTSVCLSIVASAQKMGLKASYIDVEQSLDVEWAMKLGVDFSDNKFAISQPSSAESALDIAIRAVRSGLFGVVVIDSVAALVPQAELDGEISDHSIGKQAQLMSKVCRMLTSVVRETNCCVIFINQIRQKIGVLYGNPETTSGGLALKFYSSQRIHFKNGQPFKEDKDFTGKMVKAKVIKNKLAPPLVSCEIPLFFDRGFSVIDELTDELIVNKILTRSGGWYAFNGQNIGQGRNGIKDYLINNKEFYNECLERIMSLKEYEVSDGDSTE